jgi:hypothetical protein
MLGAWLRNTDPVGSCTAYEPERQSSVLLLSAWIRMEFTDLLMFARLRADLRVLVAQLWLGQQDTNVFDITTWPITARVLLQK